MIFAIVLILSSVHSQEFHLSQYWSNPLNINPALTGSFSENIRISASYRNQWLFHNSFNTYLFSADANFLKSKLNSSYVAAGISFSQEKEGSGSYTNSNSMLSFAYNKHFSTNSIKHNISLGFNLIYTIKQANFKNLIYGNLFEKNNNFDPLEDFDVSEKSFMDLACGINYNTKFNEKNTFNLGFAVFNVLQNLKDYNLYKDIIVYRKYVVNLNSEIFIKKDLFVLPIFLFQNQGPHQEFILGSYVKSNVKKNIAFSFGLQYRIVAFENTNIGSDAIIVGFGAKYSSFNIGLSYDFVISNFRKTSTFIGSPEMSIVYKIVLKKRNNYICPTF